MCVCVYDRMYDLGNQTTPRRKWLSCFDNVQIVLFVVALSSYDKTMIEDPAKVRDSTLNLKVEVDIM